MRELVISELMASSRVKFGTSRARGLVSAMTDEVCFAYTSAFLSALDSNFSGVVLGHDLRPSSPRIAATCAAAIKAASQEVQLWCIAHAGFSVACRFAWVTSLGCHLKPHSFRS